MRVLEVENVTRKFGALTAVDDISFHVYNEELVGLMGPNGSGKTTLINTICNVFPPQVGTVRFKNNDLKDLSPHEICRMGIARTFQDIKLFPDLTVEENVLVMGIFGGNLDYNKLDKVFSLLKFFEVEEKRESLPKDLNIAERKKVAIARALATNPEIILLDEPLAGLVSVERKELIEKIDQVQDAEKISIVMVEHHVEALLDISDKVIVMDHGEKIAEGDPVDIADDPKVAEVYFGV